MSGTSGVFSIPIVSSYYYHKTPIGTLQNVFSIKLKLSRQVTKIRKEINLSLIIFYSCSKRIQLLLSSTERIHLSIRSVPSWFIVIFTYQTRCKNWKITMGHSVWTPPENWVKLIVWVHNNNFTVFGINALWLIFILFKCGFCIDFKFVCYKFGT